MLVKVCKHGNSLSVRLGAYFARTAGIQAGDMVDLFMLPCGESASGLKMVRRRWVLKTRSPESTCRTNPRQRNGDTALALLLVKTERALQLLDRPRLLKQ